MLHQKPPTYWSRPLNDIVMATAAAEVKAACCRKECPLSLQEDPGNATRLGWNVCYIACGLVVRDDKVLLIQEAKRSCRGSWYLPAGRVDANETIEDAAKREMKEESGHEIEPRALIAVEFNSSTWIRFSFAGVAIGGRLKTPADEDGESIQSQWLSADTRKLQMEVTIRAGDCLQLIDLARDWYHQPEGSRCTGGFIAAPHTTSTLRLVVAHKEKEGNVAVMVRSSPARGSYLLTAPMGGVLSVTHCIDRVVKEAGYVGGHHTVGVLSVEHFGKPARTCDGLLMTVLLRAAQRTLAAGSPCHWEAVEDSEAASALRNALSAPFGCAKLIDIMY